MHAKILNLKYSKYYLLVAVLLIALYGILPEVGFFQHSFRYLEGSNYRYIGLSLTMALLTFPLATLNIYLLVKKPVKYFRTLMVQFANGFVDRLLPAGIGGIGLSIIYFKNNRHTSSQAAAVVAANNILGFLGHTTLVLVVVTLHHKQLLNISLFNFRESKFVIYLLAVAILASIIFLLADLKTKLIVGLKTFLSHLLEYRHHLPKLLGILLSSVSLTVCNVLSLYFAAKSLRVEVGFVNILVIYTLGVGTGVATPTPGGLGGVEAGLVLGLIAYHVIAPQALAVVLIYRLISYWIPAAFGVLMLIVVQHRGYLKLR
jgi:uncharacterized protein (TIRG00374 family)